MKPLAIDANDPVKAQDLPLLHTIEEACKILNVSERTIYKCFDDGSLQRVKIRGATRITATSLRRLAGGQ